MARIVCGCGLLVAAIALAGCGSSGLPPAEGEPGYDASADGTSGGTTTGSRDATTDRGGQDGGQGDEGTPSDATTAGDAPQGDDASALDAASDGTTTADAVSEAASDDAGDDDGGAEDTGGGGAGDGGSGDAGIDSGGACVPGCPANVTCGHYVDCTGTLLACGSPCPKMETCMANPNGGQNCQPTPWCNAACGVIGVDSCGVDIYCGGCPTGEVCLNNACVAPPPGDAGTCPPLTCTPNGNTNLCGTVTDGCGHTKTCSCPGGEQCINGECEPPPPECDSANGGTGSPCGTIENACGSGTVTCGGCSGTNSCKSGVCTPCTPPTCGTAVCGTVNNGCGPAVSCGTCPTGDDCVQGACCAPKTCADEQDAGLVTGCAPVNLGCGVQQSCAPCATGDVCTDNACVTCQPKTCSSFGNAGCNHADGCGHTLDCCTGGTVCASSICCQPGEVDYQGACCQPQCNSNLPPGAQVSCGVTIYCQSM